MTESNRFSRLEELRLINFIKNHRLYAKNFVLQNEKFPRFLHLRGDMQSIINEKAKVKSNVLLFGSRSIEIADWNADLNVYINAEKPPNVSEYDHAVHVLDSIVGAFGTKQSWKVKYLMKDRKVPILKVLYIPWELEVTFVASNQLALWETKNLKHLVNLQKEFKNLYGFILKWFSELGGGTKLHVQLLLYLLIFYMQTLQFMPSFQKVQSKLSKKFIDNYEVQFDARRNKEWYRLNDMGQYNFFAIDFFKFYAKFDFASVVIDLYYGKAIDRKEYKNMAQNSFALNTAMCLTSIPDFDHNRSASLGKRNLQAFRDACNRSFQFLIHSRDF